MMSVICPSCKREVRARGNLKLAFRYHLDSDHNTMSREEQESIMKEVAKPIKRQNRHERQKPPIPKGLPIGLRALKGDRSYDDTIAQLSKCEKRRRGKDGEDGCDSCKYQGECSVLFDRKINKGEETWKIRRCSPNSEKEESPTIEVIIPQASPERLREALERQLSMV